MEGLRLLLVSQPTSEGAAACVASLASAAVSAGLSVTVACPAGGDLSTWARQAGARWIESDLARSPTPGDIGHWARLRGLMGDADVVHLHSSKAGALGRLALASLPRRRRPACVFTPHAWSWLPGGIAAPLYRRIERVLAPVADAVVAVSPEEEAQGREVLGARAKLRVIANGVDTSRISPTGPRADRDSAPLVVCVGRLSRQKGQDLAIAALARLDARGRTDVRLRLVGDGPDGERLRRLAATLGVEARVEWTGRADDPATHMRAADVVIAPSRWEGLSLALLEAMACGRPVVAARVGGASALDGAGVLFEPEDAGALAAALDGLLADPEERGRLGARARQRAEERYTLGRCTAAHLALWSELARDPAR